MEKEATAVYEENIRLKSKRLQAAKTKVIAEKFSEYSVSTFHIHLIFEVVFTLCPCF